MSSENRLISPYAFDSEVQPLNKRRGPPGGKIQHIQSPADPEILFDVLHVSAKPLRCGQKRVDAILLGCREKLFESFVQLFTSELNGGSDFWISSATNCCIQMGRAEKPLCKSSRMAFPPIGSSSTFRSICMARWRSFASRRMSCIQ